jgi:quercetin dioxygenase-like cupin family protein
MQIIRNGSRAATRGAPSNFTGQARIEPVFEIGQRVRGGSVTFEPGTRTVWHTHPHGQILIVTSGHGLVQTWGGPIREINPGDVIWFAPDEKHWHGASPTTAMTHLGISELTGEGKSVDWLEPVTDEQYNDRR